LGGKAGGGEREREMGSDLSCVGTVGDTRQ